MDTSLYIPKKIKCGFQKRTDCFTKQLAYVIYWDDKGKLRKEVSWEGWRDKKIDPQEFDNVPTSGFILNKNVERYNWSHFSSNRSYIRIHDPRGFEFEITPENLVGLLMNTNCNKRQIDGECVYSWSGKELVLLPVNCEEYEKSKGYTALQGQKVSAKDLVLGATYKTKKQDTLIYLGRFDWWNWDYHGLKGNKKQHIFVKGNGKNTCFEPKSSVDFLAEKVADTVSNYAELIEKYKKTINSSKIVDFEFRPKEFSNEGTKEKYSCNIVLQDKTYWEKIGENYYCYSLAFEHGYNNPTSVYGLLLNRFTGYTQIFDTKNLKIEYIDGGYSSRRFTLDELKGKKLGDLYLVLENGEKVKYKGS